MKLRAVASALPDTVVDADEIAAWTGSDPDFIRGKLGIDSRRFLRPEETGTGLACQAITNLFERNPDLDRDNVEALFLVTQTPDHRLPHMSAEIQATAGLPTNCAALDIGLGCSGYVYGLSVLRGLMAAEGMKNALLVTCDPYSKIMGKADRDTISVFGDAATATWMSSDQGGEPGKADFGTDGGGGMNLCLRNGGGTDPAAGIWGKEQANHDTADDRLYMNGRAIFNFMMKTAPGTIERCLQKNGKSADEIDTFLVHQASAFMVKSLTKALRVDPERVPCELTETGNTVSSSIPLLIESRLEDGSLYGKTALLCGFGVGLSWASNIVTFGDQP